MLHYKSHDMFQDLMNEVDTGSIGSFKFPNFLSMMLRKIDEISAEEEIREAFKVFDSVRLSLYNRKFLFLTFSEWRWIHQQTAAWVRDGEPGGEHREGGESASSMRLILMGKSSMKSFIL